MNKWDNLTKMEYTEADLKASISMIMNMGYTREEAINLLDCKNPDGSEFVDYPF